VPKCAGCGLEINEPGDPEHRIPCLSCGSTARAFEVNVHETLTISDHFMMEAQHVGRTVGFRESDRGGRVASADDHENGFISMALVGTSPQGEEDILDACRILVRAMNRTGETWNEPVVGSDDIDCRATNATSLAVRPLSTQVVRAIVDPEMWQTLATSGTLAKSEAAIEEVADLMADALQKKLDPRKIPFKQRSGMVLALDATRLPALALDSVVKIFQGRHRASLTCTGFQSVWIVGPTESLTKRLDFNLAG
jgi:hypothetical protein